MYYSFASTRNYNDIHQLENTYHYLDYETGGTSYTEYISHLFYYDNAYKRLRYEVTGSYNGGQMGINYEYDSFERITSVDKSTGDFSHKLEYTYNEHGTDVTGTLIETVTSTVNDVATEYTLTYDENGNITKITYSSDDYISYTYDDIGQLTKEYYSSTNTTYSYEYDNAGNITKVTKTVPKHSSGGEVTIKSIGDESGVTPNANLPNLPGVTVTIVDYTYSESAWGDLLTSYNGTAITYDNIGNPLTYYNGASFTWQGRRMITANKDGKTYSYTYNNDGLRTSKTVDGVTTNYYYDGSLLIAEQSDTETIIYIYDANGSPIGFEYRNSTYAERTFDTYWYEKDIFGNIVAVYNESGVKLISYNYNAWGKFTASYFNGGASTTATNNPYTYRGYYYDSDLELYYLQSRYYDPNTCRFINADGYVSTGQGILGYNMFAYCNNNPVMYMDPSGEFPWLALAIIIISTVAGGIVGAYYPFDFEEDSAELNDNELKTDEDTSNNNSYSVDIIEDDVESETISGLERAKYIAIGSTLGLMVGGSIVIVGGMSSSLLLTPATAKTLLGATAFETVALGTLVFNIGAVTLPAFGIEIDTIDEFPKPMK